MKYKIITILFLSVGVLNSCKKEVEVINHETTEKVALPTEAVANGKFAKMEFVSMEHDFGTINPKDVVETIFEFTNNGEADLVISKALGSCGCTVPDYSKEPIAPGEKGTIKVSFNPSGKMGMQNKTVTLTTNTVTGTEQLTVKANIVK